MSRFPSIVSIALVGSFSRGILSPNDIDLVVVVKTSYDLKRLSICLRDINHHFSDEITFLCYTIDQLIKMAFYRESNIGIVRLARHTTRLLRRHPMIKRGLIIILGPYRMFLQQYEVLPETLQTWIPLFDRSGILARVQKIQKTLLKKKLSFWEQVFYSQRGFYKMVEFYLSGQLDAKSFKRVLYRCDFEWKIYFKRLMHCYKDPSATKIKDLYNSLIK